MSRSTFLSRSYAVADWSDEWAAGYLAIPSTYQPAVHAPFQLLLYADAPVSFTPISR